MIITIIKVSRNLNVYCAQQNKCFAGVREKSIAFLEEHLLKVVKKTWSPNSYPVMYLPPRLSHWLFFFLVGVVPNSIFPFLLRYLFKCLPLTVSSLSLFGNPSFRPQGETPRFKVGGDALAPFCGRVARHRSTSVESIGNFFLFRS